VKPLLIILTFFFLQIKLTRLVGRKATGKGKAILKAAGWFCLNEKAKIDSRWTSVEGAAQQD